MVESGRAAPVRRVTMSIISWFQAKLEANGYHHMLLGNIMHGSTLGDCIVKLQACARARVCVCVCVAVDGVLVQNSKS